MSTLTQGHRAHQERSSRSGVEKQVANRRPYLIINGATMVAIAAIALTVIGILYLIQTSEVAQLGYDLSRLQSQKDSMTLEVSELEYDVARYEALQTVEEVAVTQLGMTPMSNYEFIEIQAPAERNLTIPEPIEPASRTFFERIVDAVSGVGSAESERADMTQYTLGDQ
jgi:cell division protein FtsL